MGALRQLTAIALILAVPQTAFAKSPNASQKDKEKLSSFSSPSQLPGYEETKKALDKADKKASLSEEFSDTAKLLLKAARESAAKALDEFKKPDTKKAEPQRGDPKTDYSKSENKRHSPRHALPTPGTVHVIDAVAGLPVTGSFYDEVTRELFVTYDPPQDSPYDYVVVVYDQNGSALKATGFSTMETTVMPDTSYMTKVFTNTLSDGSTVVTYGHPTDGIDLSGVMNWAVLYYDASGQFFKAILRTNHNIQL